MNDTLFFFYRTILQSNLRAFCIFNHLSHFYVDISLRIFITRNVPHTILVTVQQDLLVSVIVLHLNFFVSEQLSELLCHCMHKKCKQALTPT